jgi:branched-subunit amino acid transport protein
MSFEDIFTPALAPYAMLVLVAFAPSEIWRVLAVLVARGLNEGSEFVTWVRAVATALLTGVVATTVLMPSGALAQLPLWIRLVALAVGLAAFMLLRRSVLAAIISGVAVISAAAWLYGL